MSTKTINVKVHRFNPRDKNPRSRFQSYRVPLENGMSILNVLNYIYENLDSSLAYYVSCRIGKCTGCHVKVNGKVKLICTTLATQDMTLEPLPHYKVIKDLVVDRAHRKEPDID